MSEKTTLNLPSELDEKISVDEVLRTNSPTILDTGREVFDKCRTTRLLRKLDWNLIPMISILYLLSFVDRANIGNARLVGLEDDLGMRGLDYNTALAMFFPLYILAEVPSNIMMKRTSPSLWLSIIMVVWGLCMMLMGFVQNFTGLVFARISLGLAEGGLFPGVAYYITLWYRRHETGLRVAIFSSAATLAGAFGGLLASGISKMDGVGGRSGWSWIFIIEGLVTVVAAVAARWVITNNPDSARFLTEGEKAEVKERLKRDTDDLADEFAAKYIYDALKDWKIWVQSIIHIGISLPLYSIAFFLPTIVKNMGYSNEKSQLMSVPPYVFGCIVTIAVGYAADISHKRGIFVIGLNLLAISGMVMLISTNNPTVQYIGTFLAVCGVFPNMSTVVAWNCNNIGGSTKRAVGIAMQTSCANFSGIISSFTFRSTDAPRYFSGYGLLIGTLTMSTICALIMHIYLVRVNARRDAKMIIQGLTLDTYTKEMKYHERDKGDNASFFRYTT